MKSIVSFGAVFATLLWSASVSQAEAVGDSLISRPATDGDSGAIYIYGGGTFSGPDTAKEFRFLANVAGRSVTPLLIEVVSGSIDNNDAVYSISGIGESITAIADGSAQVAPFTLLAGSDEVSANHTFGYFDGEVGTDGAGGIEVLSRNQGTVGFAGAGTGAWAFSGGGQVPFDVDLGETFATSVATGGSGDTNDPIKVFSRADGNGRIYSAQMSTTVSDGMPDPPDFLGDDLLSRPATDSDSGAIYIYGTGTFSVPGVASEFCFFGNHADRFVTPLLFEVVGGSIDNNDAVYTITGIGESIVALADGTPQTEPFTLLAGSDEVSPIHTFGFFDGEVAADGAGGIEILSRNQGTVAFDGSSQGAWAFSGGAQVPFDFDVQETFATFVPTGGSGDLNDPIKVFSRADGNGRIYSAQMTTMPAAGTAQLDITASGDDLVFTWDSEAGKLYNLRSESDPSAADPKDWPIFEGNMDLEATPPTNTLTLPFPADPFRLFVVEEFPAPPLVVFSDDFESGQGDWTAGSDGAAGTAWELGVPSVVGPTSANSPVNCFGTNLAADYGIDADIWLRTPPIDLTTAGGASLTYFQFTDIEEGFDAGMVAVLDVGDDSVLAELDATVDGSSVDWQQVRKRLPAAALGKTIAIEFRLTTDGLQNFAGWYFDDVEVTVP